MPYFRTTITPGHEVKSYLNTLQGQGALTLEADGRIEYTIEATDMWDLFNALRDVIEEADAQAGRHRGDSQYEKPREVASWEKEVTAHRVKLPAGLPSSSTVHNHPDAMVNGVFIPEETVAYILKAHGIKVATPGD